MCFQSLQVQLGQSLVPREALTNMAPPKAEVSRAWNLFTEFVAKSHGFRGSAITYSDFCGYLNHNYSSGPRCGDPPALRMSSSSRRFASSPLRFSSASCRCRCFVSSLAACAASRSRRAS